MCQALFPVLEELGLRYENHSTVTIAKIDVTANDLQLADLDRHPFFRLFPANSQQVRAPGPLGMDIWPRDHPGCMLPSSQPCLRQTSPPLSSGPVPLSCSV